MLLNFNFNFFSSSSSDVDYIETWKAMERLVELGWVKSIGISNFNSEQIARLLSVAKIRPVVNQVECSPTINQKKLTKFCRERGIAVMGFCPLGHPNPAMRTPQFMYDGRVKAIAEKYNKTPAQIGLRYLHELGVTPIPKSVRKQRMAENIGIFDFSLTDNERQIMDGFSTGERLVAMYDARRSPYWPYGIKF